MPACFLDDVGKMVDRALHANDGSHRCSEGGMDNMNARGGMDNMNMREGMDNTKQWDLLLMQTPWSVLSQPVKY